MRYQGEDYGNEFAQEAAEARLASRTRCRCNSASESPCSGCELRGELAEREAEAGAESERHADEEARALVGGDFERCADCSTPHAPHDLLAGLCAPCSQDADDRRQSADEYRARVETSLQDALGLADEDLPF